MPSTPRDRPATARVARACAAALLGILPLLAACTTGDDTGQAPTETVTPYPRLTPSCPSPTPGPTPQVTVAQLNRLLAGVDLPLWQAGDIGASTRLPDGRIVWVFGDTVRAAQVRPRIVANSMLVTSGLCTQQVETSGHGPVIADRRDGVVHWPMSVTAITVDGRSEIVVLSGRIRRGTSGGGLDFTYLGSTATTFVVPDGGVPELRSQLELTPDSTALDQVNWGSAMTMHDGYLWVYGTQLPSRTSFGRALYAARAPVERARDRRTWQFWDGSAWVASPQQAKPVLPAEGGVSQTLSVDVVDGSYVIVSKRDGDLGNDVYSWTSSSPVGPWTPHRGVRAQFQDSSGQLHYAPLAHPQIRLSDGKLLISISRNTTDFGRLLSDPGVGRPVFAEIERP